MKFSIERRRGIVTKFDTFKIITLSLLATFALYSIVIIEAGKNPFTAYGQFLEYAFMPPGLWTTIQRTTAIMGLTLAFVIPLKAGHWNIGGEGQFFIGATVATGVAMTFSDLSPFLLVPVCIIASMIAGSLYAGFCGYLKGKWNINEIVTTLFLNYVAVQIVMWLTSGRWQSDIGRVESNPISSSAQIPVFGEIPLSLILIVIFGIALYWFVNNTNQGYEIETFGKNVNAAEYAGMGFKRVTLMTFLIAGALAGFAGFHQLSHMGRLRWDLSPSPGWGYLAIGIGLLSNLNIVIAMILSFLITGFLVATQSLQVAIGLGFGATNLFIGVLFISLVSLRFMYNFEIKLS